MTIVGFNFTKILVERKGAAKGNVDIKNNVGVKEVESTDLSIGTKKEKVIRFGFEFSSEYTPNIGDIQLTGDLIYMGETTKYDEILKGWKKNREVPKDVMGEILNSILMRSNVQALVLSRDVNLPPPIPMPKVQR